MMPSARSRRQAAECSRCAAQGGPVDSPLQDAQRPLQEAVGKVLGVGAEAERELDDVERSLQEVGDEGSVAEVGQLAYEVLLDDLALNRAPLPCARGLFCTRDRICARSARG